MLKHFQDWLWDRGELAIFCVTMSIPVLWVIFVFCLVAALEVLAFTFSKPLYLLTLTTTLLAPMVLYGIYNILRYVYETTVSKS